MSARAPLPRPSRNTGSVEAVCTSATITGEGVNVLINHAAATSFIHFVVFATNQTHHNTRKAGSANGRHAALVRSNAGGASGGEIDTGLLSGRMKVKGRGNRVARTRG